MPRLRYYRFDQIRPLLAEVVRILGLDYVKPERVFAVISVGSRTSAYARIWGTPRPLIEVGACKPTYVIELVAENIVKLDCKNIINVIVHELLHIPRTFSGGLRGHGDWSKYSNISRLAAKIPSSLAESLCRLVRERAESLVS
jgi:predicted metallopeptidase